MMSQYVTGPNGFGRARCSARWLEDVLREKGVEEFVLLPVKVQFGNLILPHKEGKVQCKIFRMGISDAELEDVLKNCDGVAYQPEAAPNKNCQEFVERYCKAIGVGCIIMPDGTPNKLWK